MDISVYVHEAGHMVIGDALRLLEQGIVFAGVKDGEGAQSWFTIKSEETTGMRSLAGLLAHIKVCPESIEPSLLRAYQQSVVFDDEHPEDDSIPDEDRAFLSGARDDMAIARQMAESICGSNPADIVGLLREWETEVKELVAKNEEQIRVVAHDMAEWHETEDPEDNPMMLYSPSRMRSAIDSIPEAED